MAFENIFDASNAKSFKFENIGDVLEAYYMGSFDHTGDYGPTKKHVFKTAEGGAVIIFGQRNLLQQLPSCRVGLMTRITYEKDLAPTAKGRAPMKLFQIAQDKKQTTEVTGFDATDSTNEPDDSGYSSPGVEASDSEEETETTSNDEVTAPRAVAPRTPAKLPDPAKHAATQALLNRSRTSKSA